jgi:hypothetical protein
MYYTVALRASWVANGTPYISQSCGHLHRSYEAARRCRQRLLNYRRETGQIGWSVKWHLSQVLAVDHSGKLLCQELEY